MIIFWTFLVIVVTVISFGLVYFVSMKLLKIGFGESINLTPKRKVRKNDK